MSFIKFHCFFNYSLCPFLSSSSGTPTRHLLFYLMVSHWSLRLCSLFLNYKFADSFFCLYKSTFESLLQSSFQLLYFLALEFLFLVSFYVSSFFDISMLFIHHFHGVLPIFLYLSILRQLF